MLLYFTDPTTTAPELLLLVAICVVGIIDVIASVEDTVTTDVVFKVATIVTAALVVDGGDDPVDAINVMEGVVWIFVDNVAVVNIDVANVAANVFELINDWPFFPITLALIEIVSGCILEDAVAVPTCP